MKIKSKLLIFAILFTLLFTIAGCSESATKSASATKQTVFELYNKVQLNQNKNQIDAILGGPGSVNENYDKSYSYMDQGHVYGVEVLYDDNQQAISKTVIYTSHKDIAPFTSKPISEKQVEKIKKGMSYDEVKTMLGGEGVEVNATEIPSENNKLSYIYRWANRDGSCIQIVKLVNGNIGNVLYFKE